MSNVTSHGATRAKLITNGYIPVATDRRHGFLAADEPGALLTVASVQSQCGLPDYSTRQVGALAVIACDPKVRTDIKAVLSKFGVGKGPCRLASDGSELFLIRYSEYVLPPPTVMTDPAIGENQPAFAFLTHSQPDGGSPVGVLVRVDGKWVGGSPLDVARDKLPALTDAKLGALFNEVKSVLSSLLPAWTPPPPTPAMLAARAERERLEAELATCTDATIWRAVDAEAQREANRGANAWDRGSNAARAETDEWRLATYRAIEQRRAEAAVEAARQARWTRGTAA